MRIETHDANMFSTANRKIFGLCQFFLLIHTYCLNADNKKYDLHKFYQHGLQQYIDNKLNVICNEPEIC